MTKLPCFLRKRGFLYSNAVLKIALNLAWAKLAN